MPKYNYRKLIGKIAEVLGTKARFASEMGFSSHTLTQKLHGRIGWKQSEITRACSVLGISVSDIPEYFFAE